MRGECSPRGPPNYASVPLIERSPCTLSMLLFSLIASTQFFMRSPHELLLRGLLFIKCNFKIVPAFIFYFRLDLFLFSVLNAALRASEKSLSSMSFN